MDAKIKGIYVTSDTNHKQHVASMSHNQNCSSIDAETPSILHDAARITDWDDVLRLSQDSPNLASYINSDNITALHHVCSRRCPHTHVVKALVEAHPPALIVCDGHGWTPLHHASRFRLHLDAIRVLLGLYPELGQWSARKRDHKGRTPLYYALRYDAPPGVVEMLLGCMRKEDVLNSDREGNSVLGLVWDSWVTTLEGKRILNSIGKKLDDFALLGKTDAEMSWTKRTEYAVTLKKNMKGKLKSNWEKATLLLRGAFRFPILMEETEGDQNYNFSKEKGADTGKPARVWRVLHATTAVRCHPTLFKIACAIHPEQAREIDKNDLFCKTNGVDDERTALHFVSENFSKDHRDTRETRRMLQVLLSLYPEAASLPNPTDGRLPLHYLCKNDSKVNWHHDGLADVHDVYPRAALVQDKMGYTPLHHAASVIALRQSYLSPPSGSNEDSDVAQPIPSDASGSIVLELVRIHPRSATITDNDGNLPLHIIAMFAETWDQSIQALFDSFPVALRRRTMLKAKARCPIHLVSSNPNARTSLVEEIVKKHPRGASLVDGEGMLPLHIACEAGKTWARGISCVYDAYPKAIAISEDNGRGWLPLHFITLSPEASLELIRKILDLYPQAARIVDGNGKTPLHLIAESGKNWECVNAVFLANPNAIMMEDSQGKVPMIASALSMCEDGASGMNSGGGRVAEVSFMESLSLAPSGSSFDGSSTLQFIKGCASSVTTIGQVVNEMPPPEGKSCERKSKSKSRDESLSQLNVVYNLLRAAPHVLT